jgi:hypothetical protein
MNKKNITKLAESILNMLDKEEGKKEKGFTSLNDCILGMAVMQAAHEEIGDSLLENLETINEMAREGIITRGVHYYTAVDAQGDYVLRLNYISFYDLFMNYCKEKKLQQAVFTLKEFKVLLRTQKYCKAYNKPCWFDVKAGSYSDRKLFRCAVLKVYALKEKGCSIDCLIEE